MNEDTLQKQAVELEYLLPRLIRQLFTLEPGTPAAELPLAQLRLCMALSRGARSLTLISEELGVSVSAATQIADRLERIGMVERIGCTDDRRVKHLQLTAHGQEVMSSRQNVRVQYARQALEHLAPERRAVVLSAMEELLDAAMQSVSHKIPEDLLTVRQEA
jgi:DNA-binding MarR family transcriptional regulator